MVSISASRASCVATQFNRAHDVFKNYDKYIMFDSRVFVIPEKKCVTILFGDNVIGTNSVQMLARKHYSTKEIT